MPTTLLTGGAGLVGSRVGRLLAQRGDTVRVAACQRLGAEDLPFEHQLVSCDIRDRYAVREALHGVQRVFHVAERGGLRVASRLLFEANVTASRVLLEEALRAGVERVVYTSSVAAIGPAERGGVADERQLSSDSHGIPYVSSKQQAEVQALRLAAQGLPVVIVNPALVFGTGDRYCTSTDLVRRFLCREIPAYVDGAVNIVDAQDVAHGHLLADERGVVGERYILGNRNFTMDRLFADLSRISGVEPPVKLPLTAALAAARLAESLPGPKPLTREEIRAGSQWWAYSSKKAKDELGYVPGHHEETLVATIDWYREDERRLQTAGVGRQALRVGGFVLRQAGSLLRGVGIS
ncbi:MAG TPA: NAD-dependent epimerase/dehydratase family protein [Solirubrobacteraceae bacterium]